MANQLVLYSNRAQDRFRWCWLDSEQRPLLDSAAVGDLETLAAVLGEGHHNVWLLLPGAQVVTRELEYQDAEKKHLRRLLPFQLEESVIGDIDQFHFALGTPHDGRVVTAYVERAWLRQLFDRLAEHHIEVQHTWPLPLLLPLLIDDDAATMAGPAAQCPAWSLRLSGEEVDVRYAPNLGFSLEREQVRQSLQMLLTSQNRVDNLPRLTLRAESDADLAALAELLPDELKDQVEDQAVSPLWALNFEPGRHLDVSQGEFSRRLPVERWWRDWQGIVVAAAACLVMYIGTTAYQVKALEAENIEIRRNIEQTYRSVAGPGNLVNAERQLSQQLAELQPASGGGRVTPVLAELFPILASAEDVNLGAISYSARNGELSLNVSAGAFNAIETLRGNIDGAGLSAELLSASAQGERHSARLKVNLSGGRP